MTSPAIPPWATLDPATASGEQPARALNLLRGEWLASSTSATFPDPLTGEDFLVVPDTTEEEARAFVASLQTCPKSGLHNPFHQPERYRMLGDVSARAAAALRDPAVEDYFCRAIMRVMPKSYTQALGEVRISRVFLENFSGDQVRFLARAFTVSGDHEGQLSTGYRFPWGPVCLITPFNFSLEVGKAARSPCSPPARVCELTLPAPPRPAPHALAQIPCLQLMGALYMGNKPLIKVDSRVSVVFEQFIRLLIHAGLPPTDVDMVHCSGPVMHKLLLQARPRSTCFTGSSRVAELLARDLRGKIFIEDSGFDWKVLGPDVPSDEHARRYVAYVCDQDAYACSGQKCSAQSVLFVHENWEVMRREGQGQNGEGGRGGERFLVRRWLQPSSGAGYHSAHTQRTGPAGGRLLAARGGGPVRTCHLGRGTWP